MLSMVHCYKQKHVNSLVALYLSVIVLHIWENFFVWILIYRACVETNNGIFDSSGVGGEIDSYPRHDRWVVEGSSPVALFGTYFLLRGYYAADARGRPFVPDSGQELERNHETYSQRPEGMYQQIPITLHQSQKI